MSYDAKTFGNELRAARLGYHGMTGVGYVRILCGGPPWAVNIAPFGKISGQPQSSPHVVWWEGDTFIIETTIRRHVTAPVKEPLTLYLDDNGGIAE